METSLGWNREAVGRACPVAIHHLFPWDRCGCKPRAALDPATFCPLVHHQRELPWDPRDAPAPGGSHEEAGITGMGMGLVWCLGTRPF